MGSPIRRQLLHILSERERFRRGERNQHAATGGAAHPARDGLACFDGVLDFQLCGFLPKSARDRDNRGDGDESRRHVDGRGQPSGGSVQRHLKSFDHKNSSPRDLCSCRHHREPFNGWSTARSWQDAEKSASIVLVSFPERTRRVADSCGLAGRPFWHPALGESEAWPFCSSSRPGSCSLFNTSA